ncbi:uncharacterized protein LOC120623970 [Pararge aegeria]|uniref:Jg16475 protein n=1 Tax=Pararge aegeria aegeria TaxID=348720 RepID=A0A8S4RJ37_9NEOP|nr:uncharacterized protein LOC120623970 [Pararge aegeria]CAH2236643.1 jg16475 [Pararge aegeria aegeria]
MNHLQNLKSRILLSGRFLQPSIISQAKRFRKKQTPCDVCYYPLDKKPCFNIKDVTVEHGNQCHAKLIRSFLFTNYWTREPSVVGLWMCLDCPYLEILTDKYAHTGDRLLAFEFIHRTKEKKLVGVSVANKTFPWMIDEYEEWAHYTVCKAERHRMYFIAHCLKSPNLFRKYNVNYLYDIEVLGTASEVAGQGVATLLLQAALDHAEELRHPLAHVISVNHYASKICEKCGMKREWSMDYSDFIDDAGQKVFFPRRPHLNVSVYTKHFDPALGGKEPCRPLPV